MSGEWEKETIADLIASYEFYENLYNPKHKLYYNKQARQKSLEAILKSIKKTKQDATINDVIKKIQILRTQFGQETNKIKKSKLLGEELEYVPKIWWYKPLSFIGKYMKMRSDSSTAQEKFNKKTYDNSTDTEETYIELVNDDMDESDQDDFKRAKKRRLELSQSIINSTASQAHSPRTIEYIINEDTSEIIPNELPENNAATAFDNERFKRRSKAFGRYVGVLMRELNDDKLFYEVQGGILTIIEKALINKK